MRFSKNKILGVTVIRSACVNESGAALVIGLMFVAILGLLGTTAVVLTTTDMKIGANYKASVQAFNAGQAGIAEARARLALCNEGKDPPEYYDNYAGDTVTPPDVEWSAYILTSTSYAPTSFDPDFDSDNYKNYIPKTTAYTSVSNVPNSLQSDIQYLAKIRHKREYDAEQLGTPYNDGDDGVPATPTADDPGSIVYYGDDPNDGSPNWVEFTVTNTVAATMSKRTARPVEVITAYGASGASVGVVEIAARRAALGLTIEAVVYAKDDVTGNGTALSVNGADAGGCSTTELALAPIYTLSTGSNPTTTILNGSPTLLPDPPGADSGPVDNDIDALVEMMGQLVAPTNTITSDQNNTILGSITDFGIFYSNTDEPYNVQGLTLQNVTGHGVLAVKGNLTLGGGFNWKGLVLTTGVLAFNGGGGPNAINIEGAVMANQTVAINGSVNIEYNSCYIEESLGSGDLVVTHWRQLY